MNPRQRQGLLLLVIAGIGLIGVFVIVARYVSNVSKQVGPKVSVLELTRAAAPYQPVAASMLRQVSLPTKWSPRNALHDVGEVAGLVAGVALPAGTELQQGMLVPSPTLATGQREIAILVDAETGVAGEISPGSVVDIIATFAGSPPGVPASARVIVPSAKVLNIGSPTTSGSTSNSTAVGANQVVPVTFALSPVQGLQLTYAESFAAKVRLALQSPAGGGSLPAGALQYAPRQP